MCLGNHRLKKTECTVSKKFAVTTQRKAQQREDCYLVTERQYEKADLLSSANVFVTSSWFILTRKPLLNHCATAFTQSLRFSHFGGSVIWNKKKRVSTLLEGCFVFLLTEIHCAVTKPASECPSVCELCILCVCVSVNGGGLSHAQETPVSFTKSH